MSGDILVVTALVLLLPAIFLVVLLVAPLPLAGLARLAVFCALFLSVAGKGGILNVVNNTGGSSTIANPDKPVTVVSYP